MSQFVNGAARMKGWEAVETNIMSWLANFLEVTQHQAAQAQKTSLDKITSKDHASRCVKNVYNPSHRCITSESISIPVEENCEPSNDWSLDNYSYSFNFPKLYWETLTPEAGNYLDSTFETDFNADVEWNSLDSLINSSSTKHFEAVL
jgi:hypothetical protein